MSGTWVIVGATSSMARAFARGAAERGAHLVLAGRDMVDLERSAADCLARGAASAVTAPFDARDPASFEGILESARAHDGPVSLALFVASMPEQSEIDADPSLLDGVIADGFTGPARLAHRMAPLLEERGGAVVGVGSVAWWRTMCRT